MWRATILNGRQSEILSYHAVQCREADTPCKTQASRWRSPVDPPEKSTCKNKVDDGGGDKESSMTTSGNSNWAEFERLGYRRVWCHPFSLSSVSYTSDPPTFTRVLHGEYPQWPRIQVLSITCSPFLVFLVAHSHYLKFRPPCALVLRVYCLATTRPSPVFYTVNTHSS
jgi:hypothetical protein